jgi:hypothetical protein
MDLCITGAASALAAAHHCQPEGLPIRARFLKGERYKEPVALAA